MEYREFKGEKVSLLGYGCMRFPTIDDKVDFAAAEELIDRAYRAGINYFDTAYIYHGGESEKIMGKILKKYPRDSFFLADKMPPWVISEHADFERVFYEQLERCQTDYFDFYLCHSMNKEYFDRMSELGLLEFLEGKRQEGKIRYIGFSFHDTPDILERYVDSFKWDFAQIQYNYLDYTMQNAKRQYDILAIRGIKVIVMEPVRGGLLAKLNDSSEKVLKAARPNSSIASWALRFAATPDMMLTVLSGMSSLPQLSDNLATFDNFEPVIGNELDVLNGALSDFRTHIAVPCTGCRYCMDCPSGVDIPSIFSLYNEHMLSSDNNNYRRAYRLLNDKIKADNCIDCGACVSHCPQGIAIPMMLKKIHNINA